jgi:tetratricopeptide (TPR) repeat protein
VPLIAAALLAVAVSYAALAAFRASTVPIQAAAPMFDLPGSTGAMPGGLERIGAAIGTWTANLDRDPADFLAATNLATLYLARAQLTGDPADYDRALQAVDRALETDASLLGARVLRARALYASHDFAGAERAATALLADHPGLPQALAIQGDALLETGDYPGADAVYAQIGGPPSAPLLARQARLAALTGSLERGRSVAAQAFALADADPATSAADRSFYWLLAGALAFQAGDLERALDDYRAAVEAWPDSAMALAGLGRARAATGDLAGAIRAYERAVAIRPEPATLAALGDLLAVAGREADAALRHDQVRAFAAIEREAGLFGRSIVLFYADHGEAVDEAVTLASAELEARTDVYGWDASAWALYAAGRFDEADAAMTRARAHDTEDAVLDYHAGMIAAALGREAEAAELLEAALDRNPAFDPIGAERARQTLAQLRAQP